MKFYNRIEELQTLADTRHIAFTNHSQMTVVTGRRRIGKTKLILKSCEDTPTVYWFVSRNSEMALCNQFAQTAAKALNVFIPSGINSMVELFETIMAIGREKQFNLVLDEFQEFFYTNNAVYSGMQDVWDRYKDTTHVNFIASGSVYTLMHRIFQDYRDPLYGRCDSLIKLQPFTPGTLKDIMHDYCPTASNDDLLCLFAITGGVPKYVEALLDRGWYTVESMIDGVFKENSFFIEEGNILLIQEFGKKYGNYYAILSAIASGINTATDIARAIGSNNLGGMLQRLENDYDIISKHRPVLAKEGTQTVRYEIGDNFLRFWFKYIVKHQDYIQAGMLEQLGDIVKKDYPTYSGLILEKYFRSLLREKHLFTTIGSWWDTKKGRNVDQNEIDIVAIYAGKPKVLIAEVKRLRKNFKPELFQAKVETIKHKLFAKYEIDTACFTLEDM